MSFYVFKIVSKSYKPGSVSDGYLSVTGRCRLVQAIILNMPSRLNTQVDVAPGGVYTGESLPVPVYALTAHFHTYLKRVRRLFSVALSLESPPPAVSRHPCSMEPGLSSRKISFARNRLTYSSIY